MSWYRDPELFIGYLLGVYGTVRIVKKYDVTLRRGDIDLSDPGKFYFPKHLYLGDNKESDYDALKFNLATVVAEDIAKFVNYQGLVVLLNYTEGSGTWTREKELTSIISGLPSVPQPETILASKYFLERQYTMIEKKYSKLMDDKKALEQEVLNLTTKLKECRGGGDGYVEPWMSGCKVASNWVPFDKLDVKNIPRDTPLTITGTPKFGEDTTTNVQANSFCQGIFPMVVVNVAELIPNEGKARFDPDIWCALNNAGNCYAARKPSDSEMSFYSQVRF